MANIIIETIQNLAENDTAKPKVATEGMMLAYISLVLMSCLSIFAGAIRSVSCLQKQKNSGQNAGTMSKRDAVMFPLVSSCILVGLYILFKDRSVEDSDFVSTFIFEIEAKLLPNHQWADENIDALIHYLKLFSKKCTNLFVMLYFFAPGVISLTRLLRPFVNKFVPENNEDNFHFVYTKGPEEIINFTLGVADIIALGICSIVGGIYLWNKHWIANNIFGIAFAVTGVESLHLNNFIIGCILLGGLFIYDIFWVFATDVMVTVANSFEAPIKLIFPKDLHENGLNGSNFAMLGLGDIVIPGIFIAFLLRFDESLKRGQKLYFYSSYIAYILGLLVTIAFTSVFKHAQPALLYIVPACIGIPSAVAFIKGDVNALLKYHDHPEDSANGD